MAWYMYWFPNCRALGGKLLQLNVTLSHPKIQNTIAKFISREDDWETQ